MRNAAEDLTGMTFGRLKAMERVDAPPGISSKRRGAWWKCECKCGEEKIVSAYNLKQKNVQSCGCLLKERAERLAEEKRRKAEAAKEEPRKSYYGTSGVYGLTKECVCHQCKKTFERLSAEWIYRAVINGKERWYCSWSCYRAATVNRVHGNSKAARTLAAR